MVVVERQKIGGDAGAMAEAFADCFGPAQVDQFVRQAIQMCWMSLPKERRSLKDLEKHFRRFVERALRDFKADNKAFGQAKQKRPSKRRFP